MHPRNPSHLILLLPQIIGGASIWLDAFLVFLVPVYTWSAPPGQVALIALCAVPLLILAARQRNA